MNNSLVVLFLFVAYAYGAYLQNGELQSETYEKCVLCLFIERETLVMSVSTIGIVHMIDCGSFLSECWDCLFFILDIIYRS